MKNSRLLMVTMSLFATLALYACAPGPHGGPGGMKLSANELFTNADLNGDNMLSKEEFENSLPQ
jgi:hypothetical protein